MFVQVLYSRMKEHDNELFVQTMGLLIWIVRQANKQGVVWWWKVGRCDAGGRTVTQNPGRVFGRGWETRKKGAGNGYDITADSL